MKKFTFIAMLMLIFSLVTKAEDKAFYKMRTFATVQNSDLVITAPQTGTNPITVKNSKNNNSPRYVLTNWGEDAYANCPSELPESGYTFSTDFTITADGGVSNSMEMVLAPVGATYTLSHMRLYNGKEYFFRMHQAVKKNADNQCEIYINGDVKSDANWNQGETEGTKVFMTVGTKYNIRVNVSKDGNTSSYVIKDAESGDVLSEGSKDISSFENKHIGLFWFNTGGYSTYDFEDVMLSTVQEGPFANEPSIELIGAKNAMRIYYATFGEGEVLHWNQLGDAEGRNDDSYSDGEECYVSYEDANEDRDMEIGDETYGGKIIYCTKSGDLKIWTTLKDDDSNKSNDVVTSVVCEEVAMPEPTVAITNVKEGFAKEYTVSADNSNTLLQPTVTIHYKMTPESGSVKEGNIRTGEAVTMDTKGTLELYSFDNSHGAKPWYAQSSKVTINNDVEYVQAEKAAYNWDKDVVDNGKDGFTIIAATVDHKDDGSTQSHWERVYSNEKYGFDANGNKENWTADKDYALVREGWGFFTTDKITDLSGTWNTLAAADPYTAFLPLKPAQNEKYTENAWRILPYEGVVYYDGAGTGGSKINGLYYMDVEVDSKYTSDDTNKPNFYVLHTRGNYDRPDKGDNNAYTVGVAGETTKVGAYSTAICDVTIMTYKGFVPSTSAIKNVNTVETAAPAVKKIVTKNGVVIVKGDKVFSVAGAQMK